MRRLLLEVVARNRQAAWGLNSTENMTNAKREWVGRRNKLADHSRRSEEAGFDAHLVKPVDEIALGKLLFDLGARKQEVTR